MLTKYFSMAGLVFATATASAQVAPLPAPYPTGYAVNLVRTWDAVRPGLDGTTIQNQPVRDVKQTTAYFDGLGRPIQTVAKQGSQETNGTASDLVSATVYDELGREQLKYLPFVANNAGGNNSISDGKFKQNPFAQQEAFYNAQLAGQGEIYFYGKTEFEASPLSRPLKTMAPGNSWAGSPAIMGGTSGRGVQAKYWINTIADEVRIWNVTPIATGGAPGAFSSYESPGVYDAGSLYKNVSIDEHGKQVMEFKDKLGRVILKKVQLTAAADNGTGSNHTGWLCTYYMYDDYGQLRCVLQPLAVEKLAAAPTGAGGGAWTLTAAILDELAFRYEYDEQRHLVRKKVPGAGEVCMVYDKRDRLVLSQDASLKASGKWLYSQYDDMNRPVATGLWTNSQTAEQHNALASGSTNYPVMATGSFEELTRTFYDNYNWLAQYANPLPGSYSTAHNSYLHTASNSSWPYPQANTPAGITRLLTTGSRIKVLGTANDYLYTVSFYDEKGRVIQAQATNISGGIDIATTQYTWAGQPLVMVQQHQKGGTNLQTSIVLTQFTYDDYGRLLKTEKKISNSAVNNGAMPAAFTVTAQLEYDKQGQVKKKVLGNTALETLNYEYNIRGWMLGANRDYVKDANTTNYFGFELAYDKTGNIIPGQAYAAAQYNGNISGTTWKARGDGEKRKYDFTYDAVNRLTGADFNQLTSNTFSKTAGLDFSVSNLTFDANGNILSMAQRGWKVGGSVAVDKLQYGYQANSNKLQQVFDTANDNSSKLGDFKYDPATKTTTDYSYDVNGNMTVDNNKKISGITYNHLNLPQTVPVTGKGNIEYVYDAAGNKLKKIVHETGKPDKTTEYIAGFVYEDGVLQFTGHEEGRIRLAKQYFLNGDSAWRWQYDYFLKDQLGNVRTVLTEQTDTARYMATFEIAARAKETALFANISETAFSTGNVNQGGIGNSCPSCIVSPDGSSYPADPTTQPNEYTSRLNGNGKRIGAAITLKVMAGDRVDIGTKVWYPQGGFGNNENPGGPEDVLASLLATLSNGAAGLSGNKATPGDLQGAGSPLPAGIANFLNSHPESGENEEEPRAYLNWMLLDEQFNYVPGGSGFIRVPGFDDNIQTLAQQGLPIVKSGYLFVYLSNETRNRDVFFDNLVVQHYTGPLTEETQYYPFGLTMAGISSKAVGRVENKAKYNGKEEQSREFTDGSGLGTYDYGWRMHDPQIGRFWQIDPMSVDFLPWTPYNYAFNNPINIIDPNGATGEPVINHAKKQITINSTLWFYGGAANADRAREIASSIQEQWNAAGGTVIIKDADGNDQEYSVVFNITGEYADDQTINALQGGGTSNYKTSAKDNFVRLEENGRDKWHGNSGFLSWNEVKKHKATAAHEFGHGLGWQDAQQLVNPGSIEGQHDFVGNTINGMRVPSIMTPSKNTNINDMAFSIMGPQLPVSPDYFDKNTGNLDPDKRKVYQRDISIVMRGYNPQSTSSIGTKSDLLYNARGLQVNKLQ